MAAPINDISDQKPKIGGRAVWIVAALLAATLGMGTVLCYFHGYKLSEVVGEITAYRYFYSLRMAFGEGESPWVPNGHTIGYAFLVLNKLLHWVGFDWHGTPYRIDLALIAMNLLSHGLAALLLIRAFPGSAKPVGALLAALLGLGIYYQGIMGSGSFTIAADYPILVFPLALAAVALGRPLLRGTASWQSAVLIALYGALCLATKITLVAFYAPLVLLFLKAVVGWRRRSAWALGFALLPLGGAFFVLHAYHAFSWDATEFNLRYIVEFLRNSQIGEPEAYTTWLPRMLRHHWVTGSYWGLAAVVTPYLLALATIFLPGRYLSASFLLFSIVGHALIFRRPQNTSFIEVNFYLYVYALLHVTARQVAQRIPGESAPAEPPHRFRVLLPYVATALVFLWLVPNMHRGVNQVLARIRECNLTGREVAGFMASAPGKTLFLIPNNSYSLPSLDSAIAKGGTDMHTNTWGDSKLMAGLFPDRTYLFGYSPQALPYDLAPFNKLVFAVLYDDFAGDVAKLESLFGITLDEFSPTFDYTINRSVRILGYVRDTILPESRRQPLASLPVPGASGQAQVSRYGAVKFQVTFPTDKMGQSQPLLSTGRSVAGDMLYVRYETPDTVRLGLVSNAMKGPLSEPIPATYGTPHELLVHLGSLVPPQGDPQLASFTLAETSLLRRTLRIDLDGKTVFEIPAVFSPTIPRQVRIGETRYITGYSSATFTGSITDITSVPLSDLKYDFGVHAKSTGYGPVQLDVSLPINPGTLSEPLLVTGKPGAGDFVFVKYDGPRAIVVGFDHWGTAITHSKPIAVDPTVNHRFEITIGSLYPSRNDPFWAAYSPADIGRLKRLVQVKLDGVVILEVERETYDSTPEDVMIGKNLIGGSSCGFDFTGMLKSVSREFPSPSRAQ